ncbi:hypothetical protein IJG76_01315 [Candidatus Saccharibacteria bacterium]|nr:hypothetical protein [Candidatus Saccharibacteria bacterium]
MFFEQIEEVKGIAPRIQAGIFVLPERELRDLKFKLKGLAPLLWCEPVEKKHVGVEELRDFLSATKLRQSSDIFLGFLPADALTEEAENAFLKNLEEPGENYHFLLFTTDTSLLLPTIRSRANLYFLREKDPLNSPVFAGEEIKTEARNLISVVSSGKIPPLVEFANKITAKKDGSREKALTLTETAIEILYKSYLKTSEEKYLRLLPKFLALAENLRANGHVKLHIVADLC